MQDNLNNPWLVAVWPGMGRIAQIAGEFLVHALEAEETAEISPTDYFEITSVRVRSGLLQPPVTPINSLYRWKNPGAGRDLVIFIGDAQPARNSMRFCEELLGLAHEFDVSRVITFAAMATPIRPDATPRVFAVSTSQAVLDEVQQSEVKALPEAEISGLNGVLLSAAAKRGLEGVCLLGEFPFFASTITNPKASAAVLRVFSQLAGLELDLSPLQPEIDEIEKSLVAHLDALEQAAQNNISAQGQADEADPTEAGVEPAGLDPSVRARIDALFLEASENRSKALELKAELDRLGVFEQFEDRFLDLFKQAD